MSDTIILIIFGLLISVLGICNMRGNISSIHWYHRQRVTEEDIIPFGKKVGLGTIIIGVSLIVMGALSLVAELLKAQIFTVIGSVIVVVGIAVGLTMSLYAMIKYNKGIF